MIFVRLYHKSTLTSTAPWTSGD